MIEWQEFVVESFQMAAIQRVGVRISVFAIAAPRSTPCSSQSCRWLCWVRNKSLPCSRCLEVLLRGMKLVTETSLEAAGCVPFCQSPLVAPRFAKV